MTVAHPERCLRVSAEQAVPAVAERMALDHGGTLRALARRARRLNRDEGGSLLLVTGNRGQVGTSIVSLALARAVAAEMSVLLIDGDLSRPGLSEQVCGKVAVGWEEAIRGRCTFAQTVRYADTQRLVSLIPLKQAVREPNELLGKPALRVWMSQHRNDFDLIILDGGSAFETGGRWAPWCDVSLLVCDARTTPDHASCWDLLEEEGCQVLGIIETFAEDC